MSNYISYSQILNSRDEFRKAGTNSGSEFNLFDTPGHKYFKLFFYFNNGDESGSRFLSDCTGLLAPTWLAYGVKESNYYMSNSAWSYLKMNNEDERAKLLEEFVNLLSNINAESPWYFSEVSGLDAALDRKAINSDNFFIDPARPKISIKCLQDSYDDRIGTLIDLYRSIVWSWTTKREVLPANLRKFDMGILIFDTPNEPFHKIDSKLLPIFDEYAVVGEGSDDYISSYKYIELHNCEIDYSSSKFNYSTLNNKEGTQTEYVIDINFDDCYETRYNEFLRRKFGDMIKYDLLTSNQTEEYEYTDTLEPVLGDEVEKRIEMYDSKGFLGSLVNQLISTGLSKVTSLIKKAVLGNLYKFSLSKVGGQLSSLMSGNVMGAVGHIKEYLNDNKQTAVGPHGEKNLFQKPETRKSNPQNISELGSLANKKRIIPKVKYIGNLAEGNTIANNL